MIYFFVLLKGEFISTSLSSASPLTEYSLVFSITSFSSYTSHSFSISHLHILFQSHSDSFLLSIQQALYSKDGAPHPNSIALQVSFFGLSSMLPINPPLEPVIAAMYQDNCPFRTSKFLIDASWFLLMFSCCLLTYLKTLKVIWMNLFKASSSGDGFLWNGTYFACRVPWSTLNV